MPRIRSDSVSHYQEYEGGKKIFRRPDRSMVSLLSGLSHFGFLCLYVWRSKAGAVVGTISKIQVYRIGYYQATKTGLERGRRGLKCCDLRT